MKRPFHIQRILIPIDFSETADLALEHGTFMARMMKAEIVLLHVIETYSFASTITHAFSKTQSEYDVKLESSSDEMLKEKADKIHRSIGMPVSFMTVKGKIAKTINEVAKEKNIDIVIMGTHGTSGFQENLIGSNASKVITTANCPIITVQAHAKKIGFHDIVLPIDNTTFSRQKVPVSIALAKAYKSVIHIVGLDTLSNDELAKRFEIKVHQVKDFVEEHEVAYTVKLLKGTRLTTPLLDYATQVNADLMIIMTDQEGAPAMQLINHTKIPIMSLRRDEGSDKISLGY